MPEDLQSFRSHPDLWDDPDDSSADEPSPAIDPRSWPLTSFDNTIQNVCCMSFLLGCSFCFNLLSILDGPARWHQLHVYLLSLTLFHFLEFLVTAIWNPSRVTVASFLFNNGLSYWLAQGFCVFEYVATNTFGPPVTHHLESVATFAGLVLVAFGQLIRTLAMITAAQSFNHRVSTHSQKQADHTLVTRGIYRFSRHPSYFGFFWWSLGIQIYLRNWLSLVIYAIVLWRFFNSRIKVEEEHLIKFFKKAYLDYKSTTSTGIPFIK